MGVRFVYLPPSLHRCVSPAETDRLYPGLPQWDAEVQILPGAPECQRGRIGIAACLRNRCLRVRISPLAPDFSMIDTVGRLLGHRLFGYIHSSPDGNGRKARFPNECDARRRLSLAS